VNESERAREFKTIHMHLLGNCAIISLNVCSLDFLSFYFFLLSVISRFLFCYYLCCCYCCLINRFYCKAQWCFTYKLSNLCSIWNEREGAKERERERIFWIILKRWAKRIQKIPWERARKKKTWNVICNANSQQQELVFVVPNADSDGDGDGDVRI